MGVGAGGSGVTKTAYSLKTFNAFPFKWNTKTLQQSWPITSQKSKYMYNVGPNTLLYYFPIHVVDFMTSSVVLCLCREPKG